MGFGRCPRCLTSATYSANWSSLISLGFQALDTSFFTEIIVVVISAEVAFVEAADRLFVALGRLLGMVRAPFEMCSRPHRFLADSVCPALARRALCFSSSLILRGLCFGAALRARCPPGQFPLGSGNVPFTSGWGSDGLRFAVGGGRHPAR